jgi:restriction endonuclease S subunit
MESKLPKNWKKIPLGEVCKLKNGYAFKSDNYLDKGIPVIRISDIKDGLIVPRNTVHVSENSIYDSYIINENEIIVAMSGATTGKFGIYKSKDKAYQNQRVGKFDIIDKTLLDNNFLLHQLHSLKRQIEKDAYGGAQPNISSKKIEEMEIVLPPLEIQQAIVSKIEELFSELDKGIEDLKTAQQQLKTYRQSVLKWAFEGKQKLPIGDLFDFVGGGTPSKQIPDYWIGDIPWASVKDVKGDYLNDTIDRISEDGLKNSSANIANKDEVILITRISPGKVIITNIKTAINQDLKVIKPKFETSSKFIFYVFQAIERECVKKSNGTTVLGINLTSLKEIEVPNLKIEEQHQIVQEIESRLSVADKMEESIAQSLQQAEALRQSILKKTFSGELV